MTKHIEGTYFNEVHVRGDAVINGSSVPLETDFKDVFIIQSETLIEMLKQ